MDSGISASQEWHQEINLFLFRQLNGIVPQYLGSSRQE